MPPTNFESISYSQWTQPAITILKMPGAPGAPSIEKNKIPSASSPLPKDLLNPSAGLTFRGGGETMADLE